MDKYKNSSFWIRFLSDIINLVFILISIIIGYFLFNNAIKNEFISTILLFIFIIFIICFNYLFIPLITKFGNLGMIITRIKFIGVKKWQPILKRNIFTSFFWSFVIIFVSLMVLPYYSIIKESDEINFSLLPLHINIGIYIASSLIGFWNLFMIVNYIFIILKPSRLSLVDYITTQRVVYNKIILDNENNFVLLPLKIKHKKFYWKE
ncbi:RDD family protein [Mycoplasma elephantis]|uniref:RDD family protein n=1 Tax=Mycoplasma elephantis TaxID=114882 RepID=UPI00047F9459|nr:RDD family protein [Mycoplasma elephantis]